MTRDPDRFSDTYDPEPDDGPSAEDIAFEEADAARAREAARAAEKDVPAERSGCLHESGCDGRSHSLDCNSAFMRRIQAAHVTSPGSDAS